MFQILRLQTKKMPTFCKSAVLSSGEMNYYWSSKMQVLQFVIKVTGEN